MARPRIVIIGAGFAGHTAARELIKLSGGQAEIVLINPTDYFLYLPLLPEVTAGILEPRRVTVSLAGSLPQARVILGEAQSFDLDGRTVSYVDPDGEKHSIGYHRLVIAAGSVNKLLPVPGVTEYAHGYRGIPEALYLRDHITRQVEQADAAETADERASRLTFVVVGAGYTGTEVAAQGVLFTDALTRHRAEPRRAAALAAGRHRRPGGAAARSAPGPHGRRGAARARRGDHARRQRQGGDRGGRAPGQWHVRADPIPDLVRRGAAGPADRQPGPGDQAGAGWWSTNSSPSPAGRRCTRAATRRRCPT